MERDKASTVRNIDETPTWLSYGSDQTAIELFVRTRFGDKVFEAIEERTARVLEEAIELFDAEHRDRDAARAQAHKMVDHVFDQAKGEGNQEAGGLIVTLLAYCGAKGVRMDKLADAEIARVLKLSKEHFVKRQQAKAAAGVALPLE
jgi:hypothetical protein